MSEPKGIKEGPPIWVESTMTIQEWKERHKKYPGTSPVSFPPSYLPERYKGGVWRKGMGSTPTREESEKRNKEIESLKQFNISQMKEHEEETK